MEARERFENFIFERRAAYEKARVEDEMIRQIRDRMDVSNAKTALKVYNKLVEEKRLVTVVGYQFLEELRTAITSGGIADEESLADIPVPEEYAEEIQRSEDEGRERRPIFEKQYKKLFEGQLLLNKKLKITVAALIVLIAGFVFINFRFDYSIFTFFTNYKAKMEDELVDKYEDWENDLNEREQKLKQQEGDVPDQQQDAEE